MKSARVPFTLFTIFALISGVPTQAFAAAYNITDATFTQVALDVSGEDTIPSDIAFNNDGTIFYVLGSEGNDITAFPLETAYDVSSYSSGASVALGFSAREGNPTAMLFNNDGTILYVVGFQNDNIDAYPLDTPYDISSYSSGVSVALNVGTEEGAPSDMVFNDDGTVLYLSGTSADDITAYPLDTAYDISSYSSGASVALDVSGEEAGPRGMLFNGDGTTLFLLGDDGDDITAYPLDTAYDISSYSSGASVALDVSGEDTTPRGMTYNGDGSALFMVGVVGDDINEYELVPDTTDPTIQTLSPADDATGVATNSNLVVTFSESVDAESGNVTLKKASDDSTVETFDVTSDISGSGTTEITINPTSDLDEETEYYVQIDATAFDDVAGNSFAGISDTTTWSFTTADETPPISAGLTPAGGSTGIAVDTNLILEFSENVNVNTGDITVHRNDDDTVIETTDVTGAQVTGDGTDTITINLDANLDYLTTYYVVIPATAFEDASGNNFAGVAATMWRFTTGSEPVAESPGITGGGIIYGCKDKAASNYDYFTSHKQELCEYDNTPSVIDITELIKEHSELFARAHEAGITLPDVVLETLKLEPQTPNAPNSNPPHTVRDLEYGMEGDDVVALQELLIAAGYRIPAGATGYFGLQTEYALDAYQLDNAIEPRGGYFGPITRAQMKGAELAGVWW